MKLMAQVSQKKDLEKISRVFLPDTDIFYKCLCDTSTSTSHLLQKHLAPILVVFEWPVLPAFVVWYLAYNVSSDTTHTQHTQRPTCMYTCTWPTACTCGGPSFSRGSTVSGSPLTAVDFLGAGQEPR